MVSKELLDEVLGFNATKIGPHPTIPTLIQFFDFYWRSIEVYKLAYLCKEWASNKDLYIVSFVSYATQGMGEATVYDVDGKLKTFTEDKEYIAIFKACEWILKEKR